jgi:DtxR family transcriptional regulator, Mn-dependent transcriptional regulator
MYTPVVEDYLKAIWALQQGESPVSTSRIADRLGSAPRRSRRWSSGWRSKTCSATSRTTACSLTPAGELASLRIIRRHRVLELFLTEVLGYEWDRVHDEAERLEHAASDELIERLARLLGEPERDPHGSAIPTAAGEVDTAEYPLLSEIERGTAVRVVEVRVQEPEQLRYLGSLDLYPGARVEVTEHAPFEGPLSLEVNGTARVISWALARRIHVAAADDAGAPAPAPHPAT